MTTHAHGKFSMTPDDIKAALAVLAGAKPVATHIRVSWPRLQLLRNCLGRESGPPVFVTSGIAIDYAFDLSDDEMEITHSDGHKKKIRIGKEENPEIKSLTPAEGA